MSEQYHFDFKDWQEAFALYYRKRLGYDVTEGGEVIGRVRGNPRIVLVVSTASYTSGYWIEEAGAEVGQDATLYRSVRAVRALEGRVNAALMPALVSSLIFASKVSPLTPPP